jgi:cholesterol transport system auxiliary component
MMRNLWIAPALLGLGGCVSFGAKPPPSLLTLTSAQQIAPDTQRSARTGEAITIGVPVTPQSIATTRVAVADGDTTIAYVKDALWVEPPARMFQRLLSETIAARTGKMVLDPRQFSLDPGIQLTGQLKTFGLDAQKAEAVIIYDAAISRDKGKQVTTRRFEARVPVSEVKPGPAGTALNKAANLIAEQVADWVG